MPAVLHKDDASLVQKSESKLNTRQGPLLVVESHPVQYRAPVWRKVHELAPGAIHVAYASDYSMRGYVDKGFGCDVRWDTPLLDGYPFSVLLPQPVIRPGDYTKAFAQLLRELRPRAVLLTTISSFRDAQVFVLARAMRIPIWLRTETQDDAYKRSRLKTWARHLVYRPIYGRIERFFYIGSLNKRHFANHGVPPQKMSASLYATIDPMARLTQDDKWQLRNESREAVGIAEDAVVVGFAGKFIDKKNPGLLFKMLPYLDGSLRHRLHFYFVGSGERESSLRAAARQAQSQYGVRSYFTGFINQSQLGKHYSAMDIFVLPSKRMGETWGLVVNEALQCGCSALVSSAVGCGADFSDLERFRVFEENQAQDLADKFASLAGIPRCFTWAEEALQAYSVDRAAGEIARWLSGHSESAS